MKMNDTLDPARAAALHQTLGLSGPLPMTGDALAPFWHYIYFWQAERAEGLGSDGHPKTGGFIPDLGLPRRMWAGGDLRFHAPLRIGMPAEKTSVVSNVKETEGQSGKLAIVTLTHEIHQNGTLCVTEEQSLVYREPADPNARLPQTKPARTDETHCIKRRFSSTGLFRYSALTFNGHRIHYDQTYAREAEGYPDLIVHGPLLAQLLVHLALDQLGGLSAFSFRATAPLFLTDEAAFCCTKTDSGLDMWVRGDDGRQCMVATAKP